MTLVVITAQPIPLAIDSDRVIRVGNTRVTLDTVLKTFKNGATAEEIVQSYPSLKLADVYATISFYLNHQQETEIYLQQRQDQAKQVRKMNESRFNPQGLRDRLLARQAQQSL